jgi:uncharacterized protein YodC (DUF2158 family)
VNLIETQISFPIFSSSRRPLFIGARQRLAVLPVSQENVMRRRMIMVLTSAALAASLAATDAQARGNGGGHAGRAGGFAGARAGVLSGARAGTIGGGYVTGIPGRAVGYGGRTFYGTGTGYAGTGIRYGTGILNGHLLALEASEVAQTSAPVSATGASVPATVQGAVQNSSIKGSSAGTASGTGLSIVSRDGVATKPSSAAPQDQTAPPLGAGTLVRLRSGGPLMTVKGVNGDRVDCFWTDFNGQISADSFPVNVLRMQ